MNCKFKRKFPLSVDHKQCQGSACLISTAIPTSTTRCQHANFVDGMVFLYVQVTEHPEKLRMKQPTRCIKYPTFILS